MCYYNGTKVVHEEYIRLKHLEKLVAKYDFLAKPLHIGFEYGTAPVLKRVENANDFEIVQMEWGFIPSYLADREAVLRFRTGYKKENGQWQQPLITLNAVSEEILLPRKMYRDAALHRRCLVLSTGFYEWRHIFPIGKRTGKPLKTAIKYPYRIKVKGKEYWYLAGIWTPWTDRSTGEYTETFSILTTAANSLMEQVHNSKKRMPCILTEDLAWEWLFGNISEERISEVAGYQFPAELMEAYPIAKDFREALDPMETCEYEDLPLLEIN
ncbi:MAG: SOS response-associated peptidase [Chitinophagaceae bacterium]